MGVMKEENNKLICRFNGETLQVEAWGENSLRVRAVAMGDILDTDYALLPPAPTPVEIRIERGTASIRNGGITATLEEDDWHKTGRLRFWNERGELLLEEITPGGALALRARHFQPGPGGDYQLTASFAGGEEKLYGMGQYQQEILDIKHCSLELAHRNSQASVPFVLSSRGYGFLWHNPAIGRATFGKNVTQWQAVSTEQLDYWITAGDTPAQIVERYAKATGTPPMMPEYGLGFWQCKLRYWNQDQLLETAREYKRRKIPVDVIVCDFFHWPKMGDFRFDPAFWPDPRAMVEELESMGIKLMVSVWPQISLESENFEEMKAESLLVKPERGVNVCMQFGGDSVFLDATNPRARQYVWEKCKRSYYDQGVRVFWLDEAEPEYGTYDFDNYRYHLGPNARIGNLYPQHYSRLFYDGMTEAGQENIVNLVRCAWAGSQRYGALVWSGDIHSTYEDFRRQICAGLHMGICGIPWWTTDIGGFHGGDPADPDFRQLLVRWFQYGTFCPVMRLHGDRKPMTPLLDAAGLPTVHTGGDNEVWSFGEEAYEILTKLIRFRERMRPYTRQLMEEAHEKGTPVMRPLFYEFPQDATCWDCKDQFLFGGDLLVAPVVEPDRVERQVYLPAGSAWTSLWDGEVYQGGQTIAVPAPLHVIPVFARDGRHAEWIGQL